MQVTEDKRYTRDTHIRVDSEFDEKLKKLRELTGIKTSSKAIRFAVDYTLTGVSQEKGENAETEQQSGKVLEPGAPRDTYRQEKVMQDAENLRHICVEIHLMAEDAKKNRYLPEEKLDLLMAYQRETARMMKELIKT